MNAKSKLKNSSENPGKQTIGVGMPESLLLQEFGSHLEFAFDGEIAYQVGSSLTAKTWRDVDIRIILPDDKYKAMGFGDPELCQQSGKWVALCLAFSLLGQKMTGLPIDFQIQQQTQANKLYPSKDGHHRSALGFCPLRMSHCGYPPQIPIKSEG